MDTDSVAGWRIDRRWPWPWRGYQARVGCGDGFLGYDHGASFRAPIAHRLIGQGRSSSRLRRGRSPSFARTA